MKKYKMLKSSMSMGFLVNTWCEHFSPLKNKQTFRLYINDGCSLGATAFLDQQGALTKAGTKKFRENFPSALLSMTSLKTQPHEYNMMLIFFNYDSS